MGTFVAKVPGSEKSLNLASYGALRHVPLLDSGLCNVRLIITRLASIGDRGME